MPSEQAIARGRWEHLWQRFGVPAPGDKTFGQLLAAYHDGQRHYHTFDHILDCFNVLDRFAHLAARPHEIEAAIWFHDAVYDTRRGDNEEASAEWATATLRAAEVANDSIERIRGMILATRHDGEPDSPDAALALDIDLSILGRDATAFEAYQDQIRCEYNWVPTEAFRSGRIKVLRTFMDRDPIFRTIELRAIYEDLARTNLANALEELLRHDPDFS